MTDRDEIINDLISIRENLNDMINQHVREIDSVVYQINLLLGLIDPERERKIMDPTISAGEYEEESRIDMRTRARDLNSEKRSPY